MKRKYIYLLILAVVVCGGAAIVYKIWNKPFSDPLSGDAIRISATRLFADFSKNETDAQKKYVPQKLGDKKLEITGEIDDIGKNEDNETYYILKTGDENFGVKCIFDKGNEDEDAMEGNTIVVRGFCTGYNMDVIVNRCKVVK
ncbi:MAG: hypothetical protein ABI416_19085 [Ginsengibacter sp.]